MQRENSPNEVEKWYPRGTILFGVQTVQMRYCTPKWGTVGNPALLFSFNSVIVVCPVVVDRGTASCTVVDFVVSDLQKENKLIYQYKTYNCFFL